MSDNSDDSWELLGNRGITRSEGRTYLEFNVLPGNFRDLEQGEGNFTCVAIVRRKLKIHAYLIVVTFIDPLRKSLNCQLINPDL